MKLYNKTITYQDKNVKGGSDKKNMIQNGLNVIFYLFILHKLINDLCVLFDLYYLLLSVTLYDDIHCI